MIRKEKGQQLFPISASTACEWPDAGISFSVAPSERNETQNILNHVTKCCGKSGTQMSNSKIIIIFIIIINGDNTNDITVTARSAPE